MTFDHGRDGGERDGKQHDNAAPIDAPGLGMTMLGRELALGHRDPETIARVIVEHPRDRDQILTFLHQNLGNQFVQAVRQSLDHAAHAQPRADQVSPQQADAAIAAGHDAVTALVVLRSTMFPSYRRAVDALDPGAALELATGLVHQFKSIEHARDQVTSAAGGIHAPGPSTDDGSRSRWIQLEMLSGQLGAEFGMFSVQLAMQIGPQFFRGTPVLAKTEMPKVGRSYSDYLVSEAGMTVELIAVVKRIQGVAAASPGAHEPLTPQQRESIGAMVEPFRGRPVNFAFLARVLGDLGIWQQIRGEEVDGANPLTPKTLDDTRQSLVEQAAETGALTDVVDLDTQQLRSMLEGLPNDDYGELPDTVDERAGAILQQLYRVPPASRGALIRQIHRMGYLPLLCKHLPWRHIEALHDSIAFDAEARVLLNPYIVGKGTGRSMHQIYMDEVDDLAAHGRVQDAFGVFVLDRVHDFATAGFMHQQSQAYEAHEQGWITDDEYQSKTASGLGKAAVVTMASALTGGTAGKFGQGVATGLGRGQTAAQIIGGASGGFGAGVGGHFAGDVYGQALEGKEGFDSPDSYFESGAFGAVMGSATGAIGGLSVGAGKYLGEAKRPIDLYAERDPSIGGALESIRAAGVGVGKVGRAGVVHVQITAAELWRLLDMNIFNGPGPTAFAIAGGPGLRALPPDTVLDVSLRPTPMQSAGYDSLGGGTSALAAVENVDVVDANEAAPDAGAHAAKNQTKGAQASAIKPSGAGRVTEPVPGLYDSIDPSYQPPGWQIVDRGPPHPHPDHPELIQITTDVVAPDGTTGWIERSYDPKTKTLVMENAFLQAVPSWIDAGKPMVNGKGTPTVTYLTLRQAKMLNVQFGELHGVKMSTIQNIEAVMQLESSRRAKSSIKNIEDVMQLDDAARNRELNILALVADHRNLAT